MSPIQENEDQLKAFEENPSDGPVVMLNLLKFKGQGDGDAETIRTNHMLLYAS
jgi:hypothetical protein